MHLSKKCSAFKVVLSALLIVALLQLIYLSFLSKFHGKQQRYRYSELFGGSASKKNAPPEKNTRKERLRYSLSTGGIFDSSGQYRVYKNLIKSDFTTNQISGSDLNSNVLALATHTTINNLHHLESLLERWQNPLSVAIFAHGDDVKFATALVYALSFFCPHIQALVDFHLVCLSEEMASFPEQDREHFVGLEDCPSVYSRLETHRDKYKNYDINGNVSYPNNLLRNIARSGTESSYILVIDIDMMPSADLHQQFLTMVMKRQPTSDEVFVLPAFEIRHARKIPANKAELVQLYQVGEVRPFYEELCPRCQAPTNYSQWVNNHVRGTGTLEVAYTLTWVDPWEPFYIGPRTVPLYNENFKQYGFNRISQACELHVAGYKFSVLSSAFVVHRGFKVQGEFHAKKDEENKHNRVLFRSFKEGLKAKYPSSMRRC
ncbi:Beta-1,4-glucuronyltransferase 1 [Oryzias melastigma]|uniref:Beta-1,4-glucuronyltransferase 1 n=1 Tax=Oryzias melastigma TaxID=30732 RepID=A0A3B3CCD1_ORYME|nr:beta-1,4-glucuronyltransferase 1 [Oryzias melastigma]KAF6728255.1 Beta-1,4-glucuronyltransferase 1 [Oryzias melastigma]